MAEMNNKKYKMRFGNKELPDFLLTKENIIKLIFFTTIYSLIFINIFRPFNSETWIPGINSLNYFLYSSLLVLIGLLLISISRIILHFFVKKISIGYLEYFIWILGEIIILSAFYVFVAHKVGFIDNFINQNPDFTYPMAVFEIFRKTIANTMWMLLIPYVISFLYLYNEYLVRDVIGNLNEEIRILKKSHESGKENEIKQTNVFHNTAGDVETEEPSDSSIIQFKDEKNEVRLTLLSEKVIYIESSDNYCSIKYLNNNTLAEFMIRNSLRNTAENLKNTAIQRCHRSYMINFEHVTSLRRENNEIYVDFDIKEVKNIPISKTYQDVIMDAFVKFSKQK